MKTALFSLLSLFSATVALFAVSGSDTPPKNPSAAFEPPKKYGPERYAAGWARNPFSIPTPPTTPPPVESEFKDLAVKSFYGPIDSPIFSIVNTKTHERHRLSKEKESKNGIKLVSFALGESRKDVTIEISKASETATLKYATDYVAPAGGAAPGAAPRPGMPGVPGVPGVIPRIPGTLPTLIQQKQQQQQRSIPNVNNNAAINRSTGGNTPIVFGAGGGTVGSTAPTLNAGINGTITIGGTSTNNTGTQTTPGTEVTAPRRRTLIPAPGLPPDPGQTALPGTP